MTCDICGSAYGDVLYRIDLPLPADPIYACEFCIKAIANFAAKKGLIKGDLNERNLVQKP